MRILIKDQMSIDDIIDKFIAEILPNKQDIKDSEAMLIVNKIIEKWIIENPTQWFWQHNRFN